MSTNLSSTPPENNLAPQSGSSPAVGWRHSISHIKGKWPVVTSAAATVSALVAPMFRGGVKVLEALDLAEFTGTTFAGWIFWLFSPRGAQMLFVLFMLAFFIALSRMLYLNLRPPQPAQEAQNIQAADVEIQGRIKELEGEKVSLEQRIENLQRDHEEEIRGYIRGFDSLKSKHDALKAQLENWAEYDWLVSIATVQANDIGDYVIVEKVYFCYHKLTDDIPIIVFGVDIFNKSVFDITIEDAIRGHIEIAGKPLLRDKRFIHNPSKISPMSKGELTIEHRLSPEEVALIAKRDKDVFGSFFYFDKLIVMIGSGKQVPSFERTQLKLPQFLGSNDTPFSTEVASLKAQLEEEKAKNTKPDITGEIKEVFFKKNYSMASGAISEHHYYDYDFFISVYVANHGAVTTIKNFKLILKSNGRPKDGDKMTLEGWHIQKQTGKEGLTDIEVYNDVPLEHSRNGWLHFIVSEVQESRIRHGEDDPMPEMEIELYALDKYGTLHQLNGLPQSEWQDNAAWGLPRIEHINDANS